MQDDERSSDMDTREVRLREVEERDLQIFYEQQLDPTANYMAAFTSKDPSDRDSFDQHWTRILADKSIPVRTIIYQGQVAGSVLSYVESGEREVSYWLGKEYWGQGIAARALALYLEEVAQRPIYARAAKDNIGSIRVLEKCGFTVLGQGKGFANAREEEVLEVIMVLIRCVS